MNRQVMMGVGIVWLIAAGVAPAQGPIPGSILKGPVKIELAPVALGLVAPELLMSAPDGTGRKFILDQPGQIRIIENGALLSTPFLDISATSANPRVLALNAAYDERGLLGLAFDPNFNNAASPGYRRVFTYTSEAVGAATDYPLPVGTAPTPAVNHQSVIASWKVDPTNLNRIDVASRQELLRFDQPQSNHNGGHLGFGPDGLLYISAGDGGGANDNNPTGHFSPTGNGQYTDTVLGKILRIDVNGNNSANGKYGIPAANPFPSGVGGAKEVYAYGFRNPYRFSFDGAHLYVADVGQNNVEELDRVEVGKNYGWRYKEGAFYFDPANPSALSSAPIPGVTPVSLPTLTDPILQYDHDDNGVIKRISIIGGFVYRGALLPQLQGKYVFGDFSSSFTLANGSLYYADLDTGDINQLMIGDNDRALGLFVKGLGQDENGELYLLAGTSLGPSGTSGVALAIVPVPEPSVGLLLFVAFPAMTMLRRSPRRGGHAR